MTTQRYRMSQQGISSRDTNFNNKVIKDGMGKIRRPSWCKENETNETVFRILPHLGQDGNWEPFRYSNSLRDYGDWIRRYDAVRSFGANGHTWLLYDPVRQPGYSLDANPAVILYRSIDRAVAAGQDQQGWAALLRGSAGRGAPLSKPTEIYVVRAAIFKINNKDIVVGERSPLGLNDQDLPYFMELPQSAGQALLSKLELRNEQYEGTPESDPDFFHNSYLYGDIVDLSKGAFVRIFREGCDPEAAVAQAQTAGTRQVVVGGGRGIYQNQQQKKAENRFDCDLTPTWNGWTAVLADEQGATDALLRKNARPWEDVLNFPTHEQQAAWINDSFPASAILYAFRDHPEWISEGTRAKAVDRTYSVPTTPAVVPGLQRASAAAPVQRTNSDAGAAPAQKTNTVPGVAPAVDAPAAPPQNAGKTVNWASRAPSTDPTEVASPESAGGGFDQPPAGQPARPNPTQTEGYRQMMAARARQQAAQTQPEVVPQS